MRFYTRYKLARAERLRDIVVRAKAKAADLIDVIFLGRDHQHRNIAVLADLFADLKSVHAGEHQVQNDQIELLLKGRLKSLVPTVLYLDFKAAQFQIIFLQIGDRHFIFNDQYFAHIYLQSASFFSNAVQISST